MVESLSGLRRSPGFVTASVLMLALGIGATTAVFSVVEAVLLRPLPFPHPDRLMALSDTLDGAELGENREAGVTAPDIRAYTRDTAGSFEWIGGYQQTGYELSKAGESTRVTAARFSGGVFEALGITPLLGRYFTQREDDQRDQVAVVSHRFWQDRLHGDPNVLNCTILLDRKPYRVIGVMPRNFEFPLMPGRLNHSELWVPMSFTREELSTGAIVWSFRMVGRLRPGITPLHAQNDAERVAQVTTSNFPAFMASMRIHASVRSLNDQTVGSSRKLVSTLFLATIIVLLIACANLAGLLLVRAIRYRREIALRLALGDSTAALLSQAISESLILTILGGVLGLVLAAVALPVGLRWLPESLPRVLEIGINWKVASFALVLALATGVLCGLAPALAALRTSVNDALKQGGRTGMAGGGHGRLRSILVVGEIAITLVLIVASGLLVRSFEKMQSVNLGFRPDHILAASYSLPRAQYATQASVDRFQEEAVRRLAGLPGVESAGLTSFLPASGRMGLSEILMEDSNEAQAGKMKLASLITVHGDYLQSMGIPLLRGRYFNRADKADTPLVAIVNHSLAQHYWRGSNPIGQRLRLGPRESPTRWMTIVGEVADVKQESADKPTGEWYFQPAQQFLSSIGPLAQQADLSGNVGYIVVRTAVTPIQFAEVLRAAVRSIDPQLALSQIQTMERALDASTAPRRFSTTLISTFAGVSVMLTLFGIYTVVAFTFALRTQEMAIRIALGSRRSGILRLVLSSAGRLALAGCVLGLVGSAAASRLLSSLLFEVSPFDPVVLSLAIAVVLLLVLAASVAPAWRAASIDPIRALRSE